VKRRRERVVNQSPVAAPPLERDLADVQIALADVADGDRPEHLAATLHTAEVG
jgi:hypothetical protein